MPCEQALHPSAARWLNGLIVDGSENSSIPNNWPIAFARTNEEINFIAKIVRKIKRERGQLQKDEIDLRAQTPSDSSFQLSLSVGDRIRFCDHISNLNVINGTQASIVGITGFGGDPMDARIDAMLDWAPPGKQRQLCFRPQQLIDKTSGRVKLGWGYARTFFDSQGVTADHTYVLTSEPYGPSAFTWSELYVAMSRAKESTILFIPTIKSRKIYKYQIDTNILAKSLRKSTYSIRKSEKPILFAIDHRQLKIQVVTHP